VAVAAGTVAVGTAVLIGILVAASTRVAAEGVAAVARLTVAVLMGITVAASVVPVLVRLQPNKAKAKISINGTTNLRDIWFSLHL
jgi:hypothetical protein